MYDLKFVRASVSSSEEDRTIIGNGLKEAVLEERKEKGEKTDKKGLN